MISTGVGEATTVTGVPPRQRGMTLIAWLIVLVVAGLFVLAAVRLVPAYIEYGEIGSTLNSVRDTARTGSLAQVRNRLANQLSLNSLDDVNANEFKFTLTGDQLTISIDHPIETPFIANLGFVVHCRHSITVTRTDGP